MSEESESLNEEERSVFRPFTRDSLAAIEARIAEENAKKKELQKKKEEGEVGKFIFSVIFQLHIYMTGRQTVLLLVLRALSVLRSFLYSVICSTYSYIVAYGYFFSGKL